MGSAGHLGSSGLEAQSMETHKPQSHWFAAEACPQAAGSVGVPESGSSLVSLMVCFVHLETRGN